MEKEPTQFDKEKIFMEKYSEYFTEPSEDNKVYLSFYDIQQSDDGNDVVRTLGILCKGQRAPYKLDSEEDLKYTTLTSILEEYRGY